ncbi:peptidase [Leptolyngbya sp. FACHB-36]|uniref:peptidase n=1 Tax=Leptolyngbya sp. FACHB-36 TaxID=2692808 RepID=UPI0016810D4A|nr:peptidase [Leptolyngbya sp. FACHB-36]
MSLSHFLRIRRWHRWRRFLFGLVLVFLLGVSDGDAAQPALPSPQVHPLPLSLERWQDAKQSGDYFDQVKPLEFGYLVWSQFPVTVFVEPATDSRSRLWVTAVLNAVQEWNAYLPLQVVTHTEADIVVRRSTPPLRLEPGAGLRLGRVRSAETQFTLYRKTRGATTVLAHRFTILLRPDQAPTYLQAAARHELGHAIGIWGHSPRDTDALFFSQVRTPLPISARDINTLRRVYQQPTSLGWSFAPQANF